MVNKRITDLNLGMIQRISQVLQTSPQTSYFGNRLIHCMKERKEKDIFISGSFVLAAANNEVDEIGDVDVICMTTEAALYLISGILFFSFSFLFTFYYFLMMNRI